MYRVIALISLFVLGWSAAGASRSVWDGAYTKEQAGRGLKLYRELCLRCHGENLLGGEDAPEIVGDDFVIIWDGRTVGDLFDMIRKTMPTDGPGVLSRKQTSDLVAYLLSANEFPTGQKELETEDDPLKEIRIEHKKKEK